MYIEALWFQGPNENSAALPFPSRKEASYGGGDEGRPTRVLLSVAAPRVEGVAQSVAPIERIGVRESSVVILEMAQDMKWTKITVWTS